MSIEVTNLAWFIESLPNNTKIVLLRLADHANERYECWPSQVHLARRCGMSIRSIVRHVQKLEDCGFIKKITRFRDNNKYVINVSALESEALPVMEAEREERRKALELRENGYKCQPDTCDEDHKCQDSVTSEVPTTGTLITNEPPVSNPIVPSKGQGGKTRLTNTSNPHHKDYKLSKDEKDILVNEWNKIANGRFKLRKIFDFNCERNLAKSYATYKRHHKDGIHDGPLKTKLEFAITTIKGFSWWVDKTDNPSFYLRSAPNKSNQWVAGLDYALRTSTYEKIINE